MILTLGSQRLLMSSEYSKLRCFIGVRSFVRESEPTFSLEADDTEFVFTPGDNDWTDCHEKQGVHGGDPFAALTRLRKMFFAGEQSLGKRESFRRH